MQQHLTVIGQEWMTLGKIKHDVSSVIRLSSLQEAPSPQHLGERWMVWAYMLF